MTDEPTTRCTGGVDWDAASYAQLSTPQQAWAEEVLARVRVRGDELVFDLGCGAGVVTERLADLVPAGRVVAVDASPSMVVATRARLGGRADVVLADLHDFSWPEPGDVLVSTAAIHWVPDHGRLWRHLHGLLHPGGTLVVQYGGAGNLPGVEEAMAELAARDPFSAHLGHFRSPWIFDAADRAQQELEAAWFNDVRVWTQSRQARPPDMMRFLANSVALTELERLPSELRGRYTAALFDLLGRPDELTYVRLNVDARA